MAENLFGLLAEHKIRLRSTEPGRTEQIICPHCEGGRKREKSYTVTIDADGKGFVAVCHRGSCGQSDGARLDRGAPVARPARPVVKPEPAAPEASSYRPEWLYQFFADRNIGARVVQKFQVYATKRRFGDLGERPAIVFPYFFGGELANRKYRPHPEKQPQQQDVDALQTLFNIDSLGDNPQEIVFVEGEPDVMALAECGINPVVSLKDGAPAKVSAEIKEDDKRFEALRTHASVLEKAKRIVLAGDADKPGLVLREELARRLGRHRCVIVTWPEGCKDACDVLTRHGPEAVTQALAAAEPYPIDGLQNIRRGTLRQLRDLPPPATMTTGDPTTNEILKLPTEGRLIVITGFPGSGKSNWVRFVMIHTARNHDRKWAVFTPEMQPWEQFAAECAEVLMLKTFYRVKGRERMSDVDIENAEGWLGERVTMLVCDAEEQAPTVEWLLERARLAVLRDGVTDFVIDPWNEVEHVFLNGQTETQYIGRSLQRLKAFGQRYGCNVWVIAHPAKPAPKPGEGRSGGAPGPYDISGGANWFNRADLGLTVHAPGSDRAEVHIWKSRFVRQWGKKGSIAVMDFDPVLGIYKSPSVQWSFSIIDDQQAMNWDGQE